MLRRNRASALGLAIALAVCGWSDVVWAQADPSNFMFLSGSTVGPIFEGWSRNDDGSFEMHFGYINRNYVEEMYVPIGASNRFEPGPADRGQPTFFYPRIYHRVFSVRVPADFEDQLVWTVATRDEEHRAVGWLLPEWEIIVDPAAFFGPVEGSEENQPPSLTIEGARSVAAGDRLSLRVTVTDDGLPPRRRFMGSGQATPPTLEDDPDAPTVPINVPALLPENRSQPVVARIENTTLTWTLMRGETGARLKTVGEPEGGTAAFTATFSKPGEYVFHVVASDRLASTAEDVTITVTE